MMKCKPAPPHGLAMSCHDMSSCESTFLPFGSLTSCATYPVAPPHGDSSQLLNYRWQFVRQDIPTLHITPVAQGAQQIGQGLSALVSEQRLMRQDEQTQQANEKNKNPSSYFRTDVLCLLCI